MVGERVVHPQHADATSPAGKQETNAVWIKAPPQDLFEKLTNALALADPGLDSDPDASTGFHQQVLDELPFAVVVFDVSHRYKFCNPAAIKNVRIRQWIIGKDDFEYCAYRGFDVALAEIRRQYFLRAVTLREKVSFEEAFTTASGQTLYYWRHFWPVYGGADLRMVIGYSMDITELKVAQAELTALNVELEQRIEARTLELEATNKRLEVMALYDALTGLPNRTLLTDRLVQACKAHQRDSDQTFALLFLDADRFKSVNDRFGHDAGDEFLKAFAERLSGCVRDMDTVARLGGDEFVVLMTVSRALAQQQAVEAAERIQEALKPPFVVAGRHLNMTSSIGIVADTRAYASTEQMLRDADFAMYQAKRSGRAQYQLFIDEPKGSAG